MLSPSTTVSLLCALKRNPTLSIHDLPLIVYGGLDTESEYYAVITGFGSAEGVIVESGINDVILGSVKVQVLVLAHFYNTNEKTSC